MSLGRPRDGKEVKVATSIRLEPKIKAKIIKKYGSVQKFLDGIINGDIHPYHNYITVRPSNETKN